jgi:hypothetical protein
MQALHRRFIQLSVMVPISVMAFLVLETRPTWVAPSGARARFMRRARMCKIGLAVAGAIASLALAAPAVAQTTIDPSDPRLVPNPIESSDDGTVWTCRLTGPDVQCTGTLTISWALQEAGELSDLCGAPVYSVNGTFTRDQTRYYAYDAASGQYLEYKRLIHLYLNESLTPVADPDSKNAVIGRMSMTWITTFQTPGDLDSRVTQKQGIDAFIKPPDGGLVLLDVGQKTTVLGEDFDFRGRWDIALGDPEVELGKICSALGL